MSNNERLYVDLLFSSSRKYAAWDPEITVRVGDYGIITQGKRGLAFWRKNRGIFLRLGNIYDDGKAESLGISKPKEYGQEAAEGISWLVSKNAKETEFSVDISAQTPALVDCGAKASFSFSSGAGAILAMEKDSIFTVDPPGIFRLLLDSPDMQNMVVVSEVHCCSAYARYLGTPSVKSIAIGLNMQPPVANAGSASLDAKWIRSNNIGNFKAKVNKNGERTYCPLFRLVSLKEADVSTGLRAGIDDEMNIPLPDATPPWSHDGEEDKENRRSLRTSVIFRRRPNPVPGTRGHQSM